MKSFISSFFNFLLLPNRKFREKSLQIKITMFMRIKIFENLQNFLSRNIETHLSKAVNELFLS